MLRRRRVGTAWTPSTCVPRSCRAGLDIHSGSLGSAAARVRARICPSFSIHGVLKQGCWPPAALRAGARPASCWPDCPSTLEDSARVRRPSRWALAPRAPKAGLDSTAGVALALAAIISIQKVLPSPRPRSAPRVDRPSAHDLARLVTIRADAGAFARPPALLTEAIDRDEELVELSARKRPPRRCRARRRAPDRALPFGRSPPRMPSSRVVLRFAFGEEGWTDEVCLSRRCGPS
jgi:hypothetical protein